MDDKCFYKIILMVCQCVYEVIQFIGSGEKDEIDFKATKRYDDLLSVYPNIKILGIEGKRDGIFFSKLQKKQSKKDYNAQIVCDPVDGTTACSLGGSRGLSVLAIDSRLQRIYKAVPDSLSCFYVASNVDKKILEMLEDIGNDRPRICNYISKLKSVSTIRRSESQELWRYLLQNRHKIEYGENSFYMQNMLEGNVFFAGDSSVPLFLESDNFVGRTGATEARIEARLWKYWRGFLVSGQTIKKYKGGFIEYLRRRILASKQPENFTLEEFFEKDEIIELNNYGWYKTEILSLMYSEDYAPNYDLILIASITGTKDKVLKKHSLLNLEEAKFEPEERILNVPMWIKLNDNIYEEDFSYAVSCSKIIKKTK